jgi:hypothetical protein
MNNKDNDNKDKSDNTEERQNNTTNQENQQKQPPQFQIIEAQPPPPPQQQPTPAPAVFDICDLFKGLEKTEKLFDSLLVDDFPDCPEGESPQAKDTKEITSLSDVDLASSLGNTATILRNVNDIRNQLVNLNIETFGNNYFDNMVEPFLVTIRDIASTSANLATSANFLSQSILEEVKKSKVKETIDLIYDLNEKAEDVFEILKKRVNTLIKIGKLENKKEFSRKFLIKRR